MDGAGSTAREWVQVKRPVYERIMHLRGVRKGPQAVGRWPDLIACGEVIGYHAGRLGSDDVFKVRVR